MPVEPVLVGSDPRRWWRDARRRRMLALADVLVAASAAMIATPVAARGLWLVAVPPASVGLAKVLGLYDRDQRSIRHLTSDEVPVIAIWAGLVVALITLAASSATGRPHTEYEWLWLVPLVTVLALAARGVARALWRAITPPERAAIIGDGPLADSIVRKIQLFGDMHLEPVDGLLEPASADGSANGTGAHLSGNGASSNGDTAFPTSTETDVKRIQQSLTGLDRIIVAAEQIDPAWIGEMVGICRVEQVKLSVVSPLRGRAGAAPRLSEVADLPVLEYDTSDISRSALLIKRSVDLIVAIPLLILLAPLLPFVALAIKFESRGPVFFAQTRAGQGGRPFRLLKFRTMYSGAHALRDSLVDASALREAPAFKLRHDPRITRVGRVLRRLSIDEIPQLVNVIRGDMSIVGPRPEEISLVRMYRPEHRFRLAVKPGLTGPMQVFGRGALTFPERLAVELDYVENLSLTRDLRIIAQTIPVVLRGSGAY